MSLASTLSDLLQALTEHCLSSALSQLQSVRTMAITNCLYLLKYAREPPHGKVCNLVSCSALYLAEHDELRSRPLKSDSSGTMQHQRLWSGIYLVPGVSVVSTVIISVQVLSNDPAQRLVLQGRLWQHSSVDAQEHVAQAIASAVAGFISAHKDFGQALLRQMTHSHPSTPSQGDSASKLRRYTSHTSSSNIGKSGISACVLHLHSH